jgi:hypothetical protein
MVWRKTAGRSVRNRASRAVSLTILGAAMLSAIAGCAAPSELAPRPSNTIGAANDAAVQQTVDCLHEAGWDVDLDSLTGSYGFEIPEGQTDAYHAAQADCQAEVSAGFSPEPLTDEVLTEIYEYEAWTAECLRRQGVEVPEIPSVQTFKDRYTTQDPWLAYSFVGDVDEPTYRGYLTECPQI